MTITKEKNLISITNENNKTYVIDVNTGNFIGLRGTPIKTFPPYRQNIVSALREQKSILYNYLAIVINNEHETSALVRRLDTLQLIEKVDAVGIYTEDLHYLVCDYFGAISRNFALYVAEAKKALEEGLSLNRSWHCDFSLTVVQKAREKYIGEIAKEFDDGFFRDFCNNDYSSYTKEEWSVIHYYWHTQYLEEISKYAHRDMFETSFFKEKLREYFAYCRDLKKKPNKQPNFVREFVETRREWLLRKTEFDNAKIKANYEKHAKAFEFAYGDFVVVIPTCAKDIIDEGANMHHCVGSYVQGVVDNNTYIVFVRHKNTPDKCYLTAQVDLYGDLGQYYLAHDRRITSAKDREFKDAFARHLRENWNN